MVAIPAFLLAVRAIISPSNSSAADSSVLQLIDEITPSIDALTTAVLDSTTTRSWHNNEGAGTQYTLHPPVKEFASINGPVITNNFADPSSIEVNGTWYGFATNNLHGINIQVAKSEDFASWDVLAIDALPNAGAWSTGQRVWAPDVVLVVSPVSSPSHPPIVCTQRRTNVRHQNETYVMYYTAEVLHHSEYHCIGAATSPNVTGPYTPTAEPIACPSTAGGAIDPDGFLDPADGTRYVVYKVDGNSLGRGGNCNNGIPPIVPTPLLLQALEADGITPKNEPPTELMRQDIFDGPLIEAPSLMRAPDGTYILFFSSNCFVGPLYDVDYATAPHVTGPYTRAVRPLLVTGDGPALRGPGGADVAVDGRHMVFHGNVGNYTVRTRGLYSAVIEVNDGVVSLSQGEWKKEAVEAEKDELKAKEKGKGKE